jgi:P27 family predicted phage terminase small subunit
LRGRKPLPTHLKLVKGNPGKRPLKADSVQPPPALPMPPAHLSDAAKVEWGRVSSTLYALRMLTDIDTAALGAYCEAYARWKEASDALAQMRQADPAMRGLLIRTSNQNIIQNPLIGIANKAAADMVRYAAEFGMTPSARARIELGDQAPIKDPASQFFD